MNNSDLKNSIAYYPGLDLLKFILALLIIAAHCEFAVEYPLLKDIIGKITSVAVPLFFAMSSFLFIKRIDSLEPPAQTVYLKKTIKRLFILFICWYILMFPMTWQRFWRFATIKESIYAVLLSCSLNGYWFIKALIVNTLLLFFCRSQKRLLLCLIISLVVYLFWSYNYVFGFVSVPFSPYYSFYYHTAYFCIGALLARYYDKFSLDIIPSLVLLGIYVTIFIASFFLPIDPLYRLFSIVLIFPLFERIDIHSNNLVTLRKMSIILYMTQFLLIWLYSLLCDNYLSRNSQVYSIFQFSLARYLIITIAALGIARLILWLENKPWLSFLKYLH